MKNRRNAAPKRHDRLVVERGYFDTGNSGISISMIEEKENHHWDADDRDYYSHHLEISHGAFGVNSSFRTPIAGPAMCQYYIDAFTRLRDRMVADPNYRIPYPFETYRHGDVPTQHSHEKNNKKSKDHRIVDIADGLKRKEVWSEEIITSEYTTSRTLLGHNFVDRDGTIVRFEVFEDEYGYDTGGGGSARAYKKEYIGKPVCEEAKIPYDGDPAPEEPTPQW